MRLSRLPSRGRGVKVYMIRWQIGGSTTSIQTLLGKGALPRVEAMKLLQISYRVDDGEKEFLSLVIAVLKCDYL